MSTQEQLWVSLPPPPPRPLPPFSLWEKYKWWWLPLVELSEMEIDCES